jgi:diadenosine tetraphosphatase ApaH/serine/threonine PP2A family protein phosphatase
MIGSAKHGVDRHRQELSLDDLNWLKSLPYVYEGDGFAVAHANFKKPEGMGYIYDKMDARDSLTRREEEILFVGHTHAPAVFTLGFVSDPYFPDCWESDHEGDFEMKQNHQYLVNAGSVGYPRVKPCSTYVIFDSISKEVKFREVEFNFYGYADELKAKGIPIPYWMEDQL